MSPWQTRNVTEKNRRVRREQAAALVDGDPSGRLGKFQSLAASAVVSSNVDAAKIQVFTEVDEVLDARRIEVHRAGGDLPKGLAAFAARQGSWLSRREAFEHLWVDGERFVYGALNAGGLGTRGRYGPFCLVVFDAAARRRPVAVFPGDSAQRYTTAGTVDQDRVRHEATAWEDRDALAVVERHTEALAAREEDWADVVCRPGSYIEVVLGPPLPVRDVREVRLSQRYYERLSELQVRDLAGEDLAPSEQEEVAAFTALQAWRNDFGTALIEIP